MVDDHFRNLQPGTIVNGRYEVVKSLGAGSMGMVYACRDRELGGRLVAMKVLFAEVAADKVATARFKNEIFASYAVNHPNVVRAYEYFVDRDLIAYTMEYVGGGDLAERIGGDEQMPIAEIAKMLTQMCCGVAAIHKEGIIHRDLKPENILITAQGDIKITDFGIARCGSGPKLTEHGGVVGTIDYVSPEYLEIGQVDARSDIYAVGVLGYEMITGRPPFSGQSVIETMTMRLRTDPKPPTEIRQDCPVRLSDIILRAMKRNPSERYQNAEEMIRDLDDFSKGSYSRLPGIGNADYGRSGSSRPAPVAPNVRSGNSDSPYLSNQTNPSNVSNPAAVSTQPGSGASGSYRSYQPVYNPPVAPVSASSGSSYPTSGGAGAGMGMHHEASAGAANPFSRSGPTPNYSHRDDYYVTEDDYQGPEDRNFRLYSHSSSHDESQIDLGKMARSQSLPHTARQNALLNTKGRDENDEEVSSGFLAQAFFWIFIIILGFGLGCGFVFAYSYAQKSGTFGMKSPVLPPTTNQSYR